MPGRVRVAFKDKEQAMGRATRVPRIFQGDEMALRSPAAREEAGKVKQCPKKKKKLPGTSKFAALTKKQVAQVLKLRAEQGTMLKVLAQMFGVSEPIIRKVLRGQYLGRDE
jgi:hypothetical protein